MDECRAIELFGLPARGRVDVEMGVRDLGERGIESGVWCAHGVSIFERCAACVEATETEPWRDVEMDEELDELRRRHDRRGDL